MDIGLVPLRDIALFETFIPSKMFEIMGRGKPIVASVRGEAAGILEESGAALICAPEDASGIAEHVRTLYTDDTLRDRLGRSGREYVAKRYSRDRLAEQYIEIMSSIDSLKE
jgi:hypothetical protein